MNTWTVLADFWENHEATILISGIAATAVLGAILLIAVLRSLRRRELNLKGEIGFTIVQVGMTAIVVSGGASFFQHRMHLDNVPETWFLAVVIEAAMWASVGEIYKHGRRRVPDKDGQLQPTTGLGNASGLFWLTTVGGATLAVLGSISVPEAVGRLIIAVIGTCMWYLRLLQVTQRADEPSRWRWTPKQLLLRIGALEPADEDVSNTAREWQARQLARAMARANAGWPLAWLGRRAARKLSLRTTEDVLTEARHRFVAAHVFETQIDVASPVMVAEIAETKKTLIGAARAKPAQEPAPARQPDPRPASLAKPAATGSPAAKQPEQGESASGVARRLYPALRSRKGSKLTGPELTEAVKRDCGQEIADATARKLISGDSTKGTIGLEAEWLLEDEKRHAGKAPHQRHAHPETRLVAVGQPTEDSGAA